MNQQQAEFHEAMVNVYRLAKVECNYDATRFIQMVAAHGGLETAHRLLSDPNLQTGFVELWQCGRLDLTVEFLVLQPKWRDLFTDAECQNARQRLIAHGFPNDDLPEAPGRPE
jgi:hypothetical protein